MDVKKADINTHNFDHLVKTESQKNLIENIRWRHLDKGQSIK